MGEALTAKRLARLRASAADPALLAELGVGEACRLSVADIDSGRGVIHVRDGKGGRDRYVVLPGRRL